VRASAGTSRAACRRPARCAGPGGFDTSN